VPDFCEPRMVLAVVLIAELLAVTFSLVRATDSAFLTERARMSVFLQWMGLTSAAFFCAARNSLAKRPVMHVVIAIFLLLVVNVTLLSALAVAIGHWLVGRGLGAGTFPLDLWPFLLRNIGVTLIVGALLLRYFFVSHQWRRHVRSEASARIDALQARIRPHFLFNCLNTIASLTRSDAARAEEAIEDLADLFRATLRESGVRISLKEELELSRIYQRIEALRLGDRLRVQWNVAELPMRVKIPSLTIQPLLENAINHGIEPLTGGGTVVVDGRFDGHEIHIAVLNPILAEGVSQSRRGNQIALTNIRERLQLEYGDRASLAVTISATQFRVDVRFPALE
jgi:two-component system sensor histidine kinase AlgZ